MEQHTETSVNGTMPSQEPDWDPEPNNGIEQMTAGNIPIMLQRGADAKPAFLQRAPRRLRTRPARSQAASGPDPPEKSNASDFSHDLP
eukprot:3523395-Pyramimonas_sp.AAC.1